jgi:hypothetical protein
VKSGRRVAITVETHEVTVIRRLTPAIQAWCADCAASADMVSPDAAASLAGFSSRTIYRWIEMGKLHFMETPSGALYVCHRSIPLPPPTRPKPRLPA